MTFRIASKSSTEPSKPPGRSMRTRLKNEATSGTVCSMCGGRRPDPTVCSTLEGLPASALEN